VKSQDRHQAVTDSGREAKENGKLVFFVLSLASTASKMAKKETEKKSDSDVDFLPLMLVCCVYNIDIFICVYTVERDC
jgi:hypothetical protein